MGEGLTVGRTGFGRSPGKDGFQSTGQIIKSANLAERFKSV